MQKKLPIIISLRLLKYREINPWFSVIAAKIHSSSWDNASRGCFSSLACHLQEVAMPAEEAHSEKLTQDYNDNSWLKNQYTI